MTALNREKAREIINCSMPVGATIDEVLDALEACVWPAPAPTIDRDVARRALRVGATSQQNWEDRVLDLLGECVRPAAPQAIDRLALVRSLTAWSHPGMQPFVERLADEILALLRPVDGVAIDRDALEDEMTRSFRGFDKQQVQSAADRVLALLQPIDGVTLTRDEAARVCGWSETVDDWDEHDDALRQRLEATS